MSELLRLVIAGIAIGSVYALVGLSFSYIYKGTNLINWAQGDWFMLGTFCAYVGVVVLDLPFWLTVVGTIGIIFIAGFAFHRTLVRWMVGKGASLIEVLLATIGLSIMLQNAALLIWGSGVLNVPALFPGTAHWGDVVVPQQYLAVLVVSILAVTILYLFMSRTGLGLSMRGSADNPFAAKVVGIPKDRIDATTWGVGAAVAGLAGAMVAPIFGAYFFLGLTVGIKGFAAAVVGGFGRPYGALAGGLFIGVLETLAAAYWSSAWKDAIAMAVLLLVLLVRPHGVFKSEAYA